MTLPQLLAGAVAIDPAGPAVVYDGVSVSYAELDAASSRLARVLIGRGLGPESFVAVGIPRSVEWVVAVWACAKAGVAFVPVDPRYPVGRVEFMIADSNVSLGLTVAGVVDQLPDVVEWLVVDAAEFGAVLAAHSADPVTYADRHGVVRVENCAYVIYTSGSTGRPKGVSVTHAGFQNFVTDMRDLFGADRSSRVLQVASPSFDASMLELLMAVAGGGTLVVCPPDVYGGAELAELIRRERVSHAFITPAVLASMEPTDLAEFGMLLVGGEAFSAELVGKWWSGRDMVNVYGPTETTILALSSRPLRPGGLLPIGVPMRGVSGYVLDARLGRSPVGVAGELYLAGPGLARGYGGLSSLTAGRFVADLFGGPGGRMYRTGDVVRQVEIDGRLEIVYVGRSDFQVQVRGLRIELGEIDAALTEHDAVGFAATVAHTAESGDVSLVAYLRLVPGGAVDTTELKDFLGRSLPAHMVPALFVVLDQIPLTVNGKLDRAALPEPVFEVAEFREPATPMEKVVAEVFADVLGLDRVGADDDFFAIGGNSLIATQVVARLGQATDARLSLRVLFEASTVTGLAAQLAELAGEGGRPALVARPRPERVPLSLAQSRMWFLNRFDPESVAYNVPFVVRLTGALDVVALQAAVADVVSRHEVLRTVYPEFDGAGWQVVLEPAAAGVELTVGELISEADLLPVIGDFVTTRFDVTRQVPVRARIWPVRFDTEASDGNEFVLAVVAQHIAVDGYSATPFMRDMMVAYESRLRGGVPGW
ncbi:amino acid adenylation domain-containing protein, partial [Skermania piniformis]